MSDAGEKALIEVNAHERECALRYERIAAAALPQFFMG